MRTQDCGRRFLAATLGRGLLLTMAISSTATAVESRFDTFAEGWTITDSGRFVGDTAEYSSLGGYIFHEEGLFTLDDWYFRAPEKFRGNFSASYGTQLTYDLRQSGVGEDFELDEIYLRGGGHTLTFQTDPPGTDWTSHSIPLVESAGWKLNNQTPTLSEMLEVLSDITDLQIRGEFQYGGDEARLDNVVLATKATPDLPGDYNRSGMVEGNDYEMWRRTFGSSDILLADGNADGVISLADYTVWRDNVGAALPVGASPQPVPEPSAWVLFVGAIGCGSLVKWLV